MRRTPGGALALKAGALVLGGGFIVLGLVLAALPGPLTIPPVLLGLWILSSEFAWADRLLERAKRSAREALEQARRRPVSSAVVTLGGLVAVGVGLWLVSRYELVDALQQRLGL